MPDTKKKNTFVYWGGCVFLKKKSLNKIMILQKLVILHAEFLKGTNVHCTIPAILVVLVTKREKGNYKHN